MSAKKTTRVDQDIRAPQVRLIDKDGNQAGITPIKEALSAAQEQELNLVEISPDADPPVCRIMDYGKFQFEKSKRQAVARKKQKRTQVKEIKFRPTTEEGDYAVKLRKIREFLENGDKIKITIRFRGREIAHQEIGVALVERVRDDLQDVSTVEQHLQREGRQLVMVIAPKKS